MAYINDIVIKSEKANEYVQDLEEVFNVRRKYRVKLNLKNCVFNVVASKFLGFIAFQKGMEANLEKIKPIIEMQPPSLVKALLRLMCKITVLNCFMSRLENRCLPFFILLMKIRNF